MVTATADAALLAETGERELKYEVPASRVDVARRMLAAACRPDPDHATGFVWTVYYDTPRLDSLDEKVNSDYLKLKVRLRWYSEVESAPSGPAFIEAKLRAGTRRGKVRVQAPYDAAEIAGWVLQDSRLRKLPLLLRPHHITLHGHWHPRVLIRYRRDRFVEPSSGARVHLDSGISVLLVHPDFSATQGIEPIGLGIVEIKGREEELLPALRTLLILGIRKRSLSKYLAARYYVTRGKGA